MKVSRFSLVKAHPASGLILRPAVASNLYEFCRFYLRHWRIPQFEKTGYLNDLLYEIRRSRSQQVLRAFTSDKEFVKLFVRGVVGRDVCVPTLVVTDRPTEIAPPPNSVAKPTHMSGEVIYIPGTGPTGADIARMAGWTKLNFGDMTGEYNYLRLKPKVIFEPWLKLNGKACFNYYIHTSKGRATLIDVGRVGSDNRKEWVTLDRSWQVVRASPATSTAWAARPKRLDEMIAIAELIGCHFIYVRVDFLTDCADRIYVGELSHITAGSRGRLTPQVERAYVSGSAGAESS